MKELPDLNLVVYKLVNNINIKSGSLWSIFILAQIIIIEQLFSRLDLSTCIENNINLTVDCSSLHSDIISLRLFSKAISSMINKAANVCELKGINK